MLLQRLSHQLRMEWWNVGAGLTSPRGQYIVMPTASARTDAWSLCENRRREYQLLRRHVFKLIYWPTGAEEIGQHASDIDWDWIKSLEGKRVGEAGENKNCRMGFPIRL